MRTQQSTAAHFAGLAVAFAILVAVAIVIGRIAHALSAAGSILP